MRSVQVEPIFGFNGRDMIIQNCYKTPWVLILIDIENGAVLFSSSMTQWKFHYLWDDLGEASFHFYPILFNEDPYWYHVGVSQNAKWFSSEITNISSFFD